jgi:hypothetical protein
MPKNENGVNGPVRYIGLEIKSGMARCAASEKSGNQYGQRPLESSE